MVLFFQDDPRDKLTPLVAEMSYSLLHPPKYENPGELRAILAPSTRAHSHNKRATIYIRNNCGDDNICIPDLKLRAAL